ncbi:MAG: hypothetical protein EXR71_16125 [Myxococcales bacterium]|nr:hypothetical protein [Myxococcales bacterium]
MLVLLTLAAAAPDHVATTFSSGAVADVAVSGDEAFVAWVTTEGELIVVDTATWTAWNVAVAGGATATSVGFAGNTAAPSLWAGLDDLSVGEWSLPSGLAPLWVAAYPLAGAALAVEADATSIYVLIDSDELGPAIQTYDLLARTTDADAVAELYDDGFADMGARYTVDADTGARTITTLYVSHGGAKFGRVAVSAGSLAVSQLNENEGSRTFGDVWVDGGSTAWIANGDPLYSYGIQSGDSADLDIVFTLLDGVGATTAVGGLSTDSWVGFGADDGLHLYNYEGSGAVGDSVVTLGELGGISEIAAATGYGFVGTAAGLAVATDRAWVEISAVSAATVTSSDTVDVTFQSDVGGSWAAYRQQVGQGGTAEPIEGASGTVDAAVPATASFVLGTADGGDVTWLVEIRVTEVGGEVDGRDGTFVSVDDAPSPVKLSAENVTFGDRRVLVEFEAFDADVAGSYQIWITTEPWEAADYPTGGPAYVGPDEVSDEIIAEPDATGVVSKAIGGLTNGQTYYVGVRAIDSTETTVQEGFMSNVIAVTPEETYSVSERLGIASWCGLPIGPAGWLGVAGALVVVVARRPRRLRSAGGASLVVLLGAIALLPTPARARPHEDDLTPRQWNLELRYGPFLTQDNAVLTDAFGTSDNRLFRAEFGWTTNLIEVDVSAGVYRDEGGQASASGATSSDKETITAVPMGLDGTLRLDFAKEQFVVPFVRAGLDLWVWNDAWVSKYDDDGGGETTSGSLGWHWGAGLYLLLDSLDQGAASRLETVVGVNDSYLVAEYRQSYDLGSGSLDFTSTEVTFGLKFDY